MPEWPALSIGRLETVLDALEEGNFRQRAVWVDLDIRSAVTLRAFLSWCLQQPQALPGGVRAMLPRLDYLAGLD